MEETIDTLMRSVGPWGYPLFGIFALVEYLFPPFPGDTVSVMAGAWAARGEGSVALVFAVLMLGSVVGMSVCWRVGRGLSHVLAKAPSTSRIMGLSVERLQAAQRAMHDRGPLLLVANRFLPSFRAVLFVAAGASGLSWRATVAWGSISAAVFNALLVGVGVAVGDNAEAIAGFFSRFRWFSLAVLAVLLAFLGWRWWRGRARS